MSDTVIVAIIASLAPTLTVLLAWRKQQRALAEIHAVVNSRLDVALLTIRSLEAEIRRLNAALNP